MANLIVKSISIWILLAIFAVLNGLFREKALIPLLGIKFSLPLSGIIFSLIILLLTFLFIPWFGRVRTNDCLCVGLIWLILTISFEFLFGHYVMGKSWLETFQVLNVKNGNLFSLILVVSVASPWFAAKLRRILVTTQALRPKVDRPKEKCNA